MGGNRSRLRACAVALALAGSCLLVPASAHADGLTPVTTEQIAATSPSPDVYAPVQGLTAFKTELYYVSVSLGGERILWRSDGRSAQVFAVLDVPNTTYLPVNMTEFHDVLYISSPGTNGGLWRTDGLTTQRLETPTHQWVTPQTELTPLGDRLYFAATMNGDDELWRTDGTTVERVADINTAGSSDPTGFTEFNGALYFAASTPQYGRELWRTDGGITEVVVDVLPGNSNSNPYRLTEYNGELYFGSDNYYGYSYPDVWRTDGTAAGTVAVQDVNGYNGAKISRFAVYGGRLYFAAAYQWGGAVNEIWRTDGTTTERLLSSTASQSTQIDFVPFGGQLYFGFDGPPSPFKGRELWRTDGTTIDLFAELDPGWEGSDPRNFAAFDGWLYFSATAPPDGNELWRTNGTVVEQVTRIYPEGYGSHPSEPVVLGEHLFFGALSAAGTGLWRYGPGVPPSVTLRSPRSGAVYDMYQPVLADFQCAAGAMVLVVTECTGTVPAGSRVDTTPGAHTFQVVAKDSVGRTTTVSVNYTVRSPAPPPPPRFCRGYRATVVGKSGGGIITGTSGRDVIVGSPERDVIRGRGGNDIICGGAGSDDVYGGSGNDRIYGGTGDDWISGGGGRDYLVGQDGRDELNGDGGQDTCNGGPGRDTVLNCP